MSSHTIGRVNSINSSNVESDSSMAMSEFSLSHAKGKRMLKKFIAKRTSI